MAHVTFKGNPWLIVTLAASCLLIAVAGGLFYSNQRNALIRDAESDLLAIASLKSDQISQWRSELLADAAVIQQGTGILNTARLVLDTRTDEDVEELLSRFQGLIEVHGFADIYLIDPSSEVLLSTGNASGFIDPHVLRIISGAVSSGLPVLTDLHADPGHDAIHFTIVTPIPQGSEGEGNLGCILLLVDPARFLFPLIQSWPGDSRSAETLIVRADGDSVLFLNDLRHMSGPSMSLRLPLTRTDIPAVQAMHGVTGVTRGVDYRGESVIAIIRPIKDSPWTMIAKVDREEILAVWRLPGTLIVLITLLLMVAVAAALTAQWQRGAKLQYRKLLKTEQALVAMREAAEEDRLQLEAQLTQAGKMEAIGRLAGGVAHDFNNMLQTILGYTEMALLDLGEEDHLRSMLLDIQKAATRSADLTGQLLAFARKQTISPQVVNLNDAVSGTLRMLGRLIGEDITLTWKPGGEVQPVLIDPAQLSQILVNLAINARDAIDSVGELTIETDSCEVDEGYCEGNPGAVPGGYSVLIVSDTGSGMDRETLSMIFEPFFTTKTKEKGTGLGLATVYGIVKQNGGFINVYSESGTGTSFRIYLPELDASSSERTVEPLSSAIPGGTETVLVVEDEETLLHLSAKMLQNLGYTTVTASMPAEALELVSKGALKVDILLTDVIMPEMSGRDLSSRLSELVPDVKCIYMSGYTANIITHHGVLDQDVHFLQKPFTRTQLARKIREVLDQGVPPASTVTGEHTPD